MTESALTDAPWSARDEEARRAAQDAHDVVMATFRALPIWTVRQTPAGFVARLGYSKPGIEYVTDIALTDPALCLLRAALPVGLVRFERDPSDASDIVEVWL